jgi:hypothetical protein
MRNRVDRDWLFANRTKRLQDFSAIYAFLDTEPSTSWVDRIGLRIEPTDSWTRDLTPIRRLLLSLPNLHVTSKPSLTFPLAQFPSILTPHPKFHSGGPLSSDLTTPAILLLRCKTTFSPFSPSLFPIPQRLTEKQVADGLSKLSHPHGGFLEGLTMYSPTFQSGPTRIIGPVFTVKFVPKSDDEAPRIKGHYVR